MPSAQRGSAIAEISYVSGHYAVQGHSRSLIFFLMQSLHYSFVSVNNIPH